MTQENKRLRIHLASFDLIKGVSMLIIIFIHMMRTDHYDGAELAFLEPFISGLPIFGFIIPLLLIISGFGFKAKTGKAMLRKTFQEMIVPYLWVALIIAAIYPAVFFLHNHNWEESVNVMICYALAYLLGIPEYGKVILGYGVAWISAVWYLLTLFWAFNVLNVFVKIKKKTLQAAAVLVCFLVGYMLLIRDINYYCIPQGLMAVAYCYLGCLIKEYKLLERITKYHWFLTALIPIALAHILWGEYNLCTGDFRYGLLDCIGAGCAGVLVVFAGTYIGSYQWRCLEWIKKIGAYTYWILCIHSVESGFPQWAAMVDLWEGRKYIALAIEILLKAVLITAVCFVLKRIARYQYRNRLLCKGN